MLLAAASAAGIPLAGTLGYGAVAAPAVAYSAPALAYSAPALVKTVAAAPVAYAAAPAVVKTYAAAPVAYAAAPAVAYAAPAVAAVKTVAVAAPITKTVHYENRPVVTGYTSQVNMTQVMMTLGLRG